MDSWLMGCRVMSKPARVSICVVAEAKKIGPASAPASSRRRDVRAVRWAGTPVAVAVMTSFLVGGFSLATSDPGRDF
ncbi:MULTISPECIES: hypothetical protein [unclassified Nonomuraea]|uniref:hypothetical protein n=1 Tax=unclassified Nonomuraea TaxID=2593643 RepID=UPI0033FB99CC